MVQQAGNFLLVPFPAFGHITALLELARKIVASGHHATFLISEHLLIDMRNRKMMTPAEEKNIHFVGLKDDVIIPSDITSNPGLWKGIYVKMDAAFEKFLGSMPVKNDPSGSSSSTKLAPVDVVVVDISINDVPFRVPHSRGIPVVGFSPFSGFMTTRILSVNEDSPSVPDEDLYKELAPGAIIDIWKQSVLKMKKGLTLADGLVINSFAALEPEFEGNFKTACPEFTKLKFGFIGPILPPSTKTDAQVEQWLNTRNDRSVVYFSFGSITMVNAAQVREVADALIGLGRPFIWSLQAAQQEYLTKEIRKNIARQIENADTPYLILSWAPQKMILQHKAVRLFVSHCGWNSTLECISSGVPIVGWPMFGDQHDNADLVVNSGCGLRMNRVDMSGGRIVKKEELTDLIESVAQWEKPVEDNEYFATAQRLSVAALDAISAAGGSSTTTFDFLLSLSHQTSQL